MRKIGWKWVPALCVLAMLPASAGFGQGKTRRFDVMETTIDQVEASYKSGRLTARELVQQYMDRMAAYDKRGLPANCAITLNPKALEEADRLDAEYKKSGPVGPLHGIPILANDPVDVPGMPATPGPAVLKDDNPALDSFVVAKLRKAGAIILGKTTLGAGQTYGSLYGVIANPYDLARTVGRSLGSSGACLPSTFTTVALGEEGFPSTRRLGTRNESVAMRLTPGLISGTGTYDDPSSLAGSLGPTAGTVTDIARLLDVMVGYDPDDPLTALAVGQMPASYTKFLDKDGLKRARLGIIRQPLGSTLIGASAEPGSEDFKKVSDALNNALAELKAAGAELIDPIILPDLSKLATTQAPKVRELLKINIMKEMAEYKLDAIVYGTPERQATRLQDGISQLYVNQQVSPDVNVFPAVGATITVRAGFTIDGLPIAITFFGTPYSEPMLLRLAYSYEQATNHWVQPQSAPPFAASGSFTSSVKSISPALAPVAKND